MCVCLHASESKPVCQYEGNGEGSARYMKVQRKCEQGFGKARLNEKRGEASHNTARRAQTHAHRPVCTHTHLGRLQAGLRLVR